jgi:hypothetical protein
MDEPLPDGFTISMFPEGNLNMAPLPATLRYLPIVERIPNVQSATVQPVHEPATDYRHISDIEQIMSHYDTQHDKFDLYGMGIEQIDAHVFEQMAQMQKPVRWLDLSCNRITEPPTALELLPAQDLVLQINQNPFLRRVEWTRCIRTLKHENPGWIILDGVL